ncbi:MAG: peptidylprolyl isomerase [Phycisphaerae bacterium]|nr:peptidylprolyl isomerase [Phycisphaerae bacterium]
MKRTVFLMVLGSIHAGLAMAATEPSPASQPAATQPTTSAPVVLGADGSPVLAYFGNIEITEASVDKMIQVPTSGPALPDEVLHRKRQDAVSNEMLRYMYETYWKEHPDLVSEEEIANELNSLKDRLERSGQKLEDLLSMNNMTEAALRDRLALQVVHRKVREAASSDEKVDEFYEAHKDEFDGTMLVVTHILIRVHPVFGTPADSEAAKAKLAELKKQITAGEITFDAAMREHSEDLSWTRQPEMGPFPRHGRMVDSFAAAAFALQPGEISEPVESRFGWHLIQCISRSSGQAAPPEQAKAIIRQVLSNDAVQLLQDQQTAKHPIRILMEYVKPPRPTPPPLPPTTQPQATRPANPVRRPQAPSRARPQPQTQPGADRTQPRALPPGGPTAPPAP